MNHGKNICKQLNLTEEREQSKKRFALPSRGKVLCEALKEVRRRIAEENDIPLEIEECTYKGECRGTCPRCEAEVQYLEKSLAERISLGKVATVAGLALGLAAPGAATAQDTISTKNAENIPIIEIPSGEYFMGIITDDPQNLEYIPVDTLPTVLPIHKDTIAKLKFLPPAQSTDVEAYKLQEEETSTVRGESGAVRESSNVIKRRRITVPKDKETQDSFQIEFNKDNGTPARQSISTEQPKMFEEEEENMKIIVK